MAQSVFRKPNGGRFSKFTPRKLYHGRVINPDTGEILDEGLVAAMPAPHSYTGEDVVEIHGHGSQVSLRATLRLVVDHGARPAEPGEFTRRAFLNGRLDLIQAEAVADIISARSQAGLRAALGHLSGRLSRELDEVWSDLIEISAQLEAAVDFPDEDLEIQASERLAERAALARNRLVWLLNSFRAGKAVREGTPVAIIGRPNVGKSSLLNLLLREDRALTSPYPGTTRDTIEETAVIGGIPFRFIDTAGLRKAENPVEQAGIDRAQRMVEAASMVLVVVDGSAPLAREDVEILDSVCGRTGLAEGAGLAVIGVLNKMDLGMGLNQGEAQGVFGKNRLVRLSALRGDGLEDLEAAMVEAALGGASANEELMLTRERHRERVKAAADSVTAGIKAMETGLSPELVSVEFTEALEALAALLGKTFTEDLLDAVFSEFCIGK